MNVRYPNGTIKICGHNQVIPIGQGKSCPGFDVREYAKALGLQPNQIVQDEPKCFNKLDIVITSLTSGILFMVILLLFKIVDAKIGNVAFFEPDIFTLPDKIFLPLIISFCIN